MPIPRADAKTTTGVPPLATTTALANQDYSSLLITVFATGPPTSSAPPPLPLPLPPVHHLSPLLSLLLLLPLPLLLLALSLPPPLAPAPSSTSLIFKVGQTLGKAKPLTLLSPTCLLISPM